MPSEFPFPSVNSSYPTPLYYQEEPEGFRVHRTIFDDNTHEKSLQAAASGVRTFRIRYDGLTLAEALILDTWAESMFYDPENGSGYGANFRCHVPGTVWTNTSGDLLSNVYIAPGGYIKSHSQATIQAREFILEKR